MKKANTSILWEGLSEYTGQSIYTTINLTSSNIKTGNIPQITMLCTDEKPTDALKSGLDEAICGGCRLRPINHKQLKMEDQPCYVNCGFGPNAIHRTKDKLLPTDPAETYEIGRDGAHGDPAARPKNVSLSIRAKFKKLLGYTHNWQDKKSQYLSKWCMASIHSLSEKIEANKKGFRTFRTVKFAASKLASDEIVCPNFTRSIQCKDCGLCAGNDVKAKNIVIPIH